MELDVNFKEGQERPAVKPKTVEGKSRSGPQRKLSFQDSEFNRKQSKSFQKKQSEKQDLAA
jgi:hypothetical protein